MIQTLEELSMNAWPSLQTLLYDGWVLRFANGYTRRANSVHPLYLPRVALDEKIQVCEKFYREKGLHVVFKMTPASTPDGLDAALAARGYAVDAPTSVQVLDVTDWTLVPPEGVATSELISDRWLGAACALGGIDSGHRSTLEEMLQAVIPARCFASIEQAGEVIACGMGVLQDGFAGLFDIVTDARFRRQGYGESLVRGILAWGKQQGAHTAYLQVMLNNEPALRLYEKLGFKEAYQYWYRVKLG